ncbi:unnamed protein product [Somion occarium]|uniref:Thioredoxin domain-containing protein n=1 Tax=Somion occarium TaxID=3059160 RepID=A0ABP1DYK4_9APHY
MVQEIKNLAEFKEIISGDKVVIIDFWAEWCGPCKQISPIFEKLSADFPNLAFYKVNVDEASDISEEVGIRAVYANFHGIQERRQDWRICRCYPHPSPGTDRVSCSAGMKLLTIGL